MLKPWFFALASAVMGSVLSLTLVGQAQPNRLPSAVAYVNPNRVLNESVHGRSEFSRVQALQQRKNTELRTKQQALEATRTQLPQAADAAARARLQQQEQEQRTDLERSTQAAQAELQALQREINTDMAQRVKSVLDELMKTQPYQLVLNGDASVIWSAGEVDLTAAVVARLNGQ